MREVHNPAFHTAYFISGVGDTRRNVIMIIRIMGLKYNVNNWFSADFQSHSVIKSSTTRYPHYRLILSQITADWTIKELFKHWYVMWKLRIQLLQNVWSLSITTCCSYDKFYIRTTLTEGKFSTCVCLCYWTLLANWTSTSGTGTLI